MSKTTSSESILHDWVHELKFQQQALLLTSIRGADGCCKHNTAKMIVRYLRGEIIKPAGDWDGRNNNNFMWGEYYIETVTNSVSTRLFEQITDNFWEDHDEYPHHFIMHLVHCAEVIGYKHPDEEIKRYWHRFYIKACEAFHMNPETHKQMDNRLNDFETL